jgi:membrane protease YdiL (CAAX protease family)
MTAIFWNHAERRVRAGWRLLLFVLLVIGLSVAAGAIGPLQVGSYYANLVVTALAGMAAALLLVGALGRFLDHRPFIGFGLVMSGRWWGEVGFGFALGGVLMAVIFGVELAAGWIQIRDPVARASNSFSTVALAAQVVLFSATSLTEELLNRGYLLRNLAEGLTVPRLRTRAALGSAAVISAVVFALLHWDNNAASITSTVNIGVAGLLLALPVLLTNSLALSLGLHFAWNLFEGPVFGFPVSGENVGQTLFDIVQKGPVIWTGGAFGPEAGLLAIIANLAGGAAIIGWVRWRQGHAELLPAVAEYRRRPEPEATVMDLLS